jgi:hypothetical protein
MGYNNKTKAYRVYKATCHKLFISKNIRFDKTFFQLTEYKYLDLLKNFDVLLLKDLDRPIAISANPIKGVAASPPPATTIFLQYIQLSLLQHQPTSHLQLQQLKTLGFQNYPFRCVYSSTHAQIASP